MNKQIGIIAKTKYGKIVFNECCLVPTGVKSAFGRLIAKSTDLNTTLYCEAVYVKKDGKLSDHYRRCTIAVTDRNVRIYGNGLVCRLIIESLGRMYFEDKDVHRFWLYTRSQP